MTTEEMTALVREKANTLSPFLRYRLREDWEEVCATGDGLLRLNKQLEFIDNRVRRGT